MDTTTTTATTAATATASASGPLTGITVLDLSRALSGPFSTALLADRGAAVIKAESIKGGVSSRSWPPFENEHSLYNDSVNLGKSSVAVDFYAPEGKDLLGTLALAPDVLIENSRPGVLATMGLDPDPLRAGNRHGDTELPLLRGPLSANGQPTPVTKAPPGLGEDTRNVLQDLALPPGQIEKLIASGSVAETHSPDRPRA